MGKEIPSLGLPWADRGYYFRKWLVKPVRGQRFRLCSGRAVTIPEEMLWALPRASPSHSDSEGASHPP